MGDRRLAKNLQVMPKPPQKISFTIEGKVRSKKNGKQIAFNKKTGRRFVRSSDLFKQWEIEAKAQLIMQRDVFIQQYGSIFPMKGPLRLTIRFAMQGLAHEPDLSNLIEGPQDILQEIGIISNDKQITEIEAYKQMDFFTDNCSILLSPAWEG